MRYCPEVTAMHFREIVRDDTVVYSELRHLHQNAYSKKAALRGTSITPRASFHPPGARLPDRQRRHGELGTKDARPGALDQTAHTYCCCEHFIFRHEKTGLFWRRLALEKESAKSCAVCSINLE